MNSPEIVGTVVAVQANFYQVRLDSQVSIGGDDQQPIEVATLLCTRRTRLKKIGQQVMVGDRALVEEPDWAGGRGAISQVLPRRTELDRPPIANVDRFLLIFAIAEPDLDPIALSRFLVKAESTGLEVSLCLNKCDLVAPEHLVKWRDRLGGWGYEPIFISVLNGINIEQTAADSQHPVCADLVANPNLSNKIDRSQLPSATALYRQLQGKITVVCGPSGVGKSSTIDQLIPGLHLRVGKVSGKLGRGRHTTRHVELFELPGGGLLADTPGFDRPSLECEPQQLALYFPEARQRLAAASCQFSDCLHRDEPNCAVRGDWERYEHYLNFLEEAIDRQQALQNSTTAEATLKQKTKSDGTQQYEPKLQAKKYRRSSRRLEHQTLQDMCQNLDEF
ncbi:MAG: ribosome small subunit-dependent GTPase A [Oscillatoriaceae cyanobacterium Prado104]|jgi:ribosome biogenesis GTPase|nr:ribosome small subunit-dependent GTPase A [Oscillatoriaceae cyanobacterium Prado104]